MQYRSPLRPLDIGYVSRLAGVAIDWDATTIGPMTAESLPTRIYAFAGALPTEIVTQLDLVVA